MSLNNFSDLAELSRFLRQDLVRKRLILLYAHNGTGKTRLSTVFKDLGKAGGEPDTLYFNAFTEDLFSWDNDLEGDRERKLKINKDSRFITALWELEMDTRVRPHLARYADFEFVIDTAKWEVSFSRELRNPNYDANATLNENGENPSGERTLVQSDIKISRGEENIFIWCFFMALVQIVIDGDENGPYAWVKNIYIDDPISSLDEQNAVKVAHDITGLIASSRSSINVVISTHHVLFYNVVANQLRNKVSKYYLTQATEPGAYCLESWENVPPFLHLSTLLDLCKTRDSGDLSSHHFNMLRRLLEQTAAFLGYESWIDCLKPQEGESEKAFQKRILDLNSHGDWVIFESPRIDDSMRSSFLTILEEFRRSFPFNPTWFPPAATPVAAPASISPPNSL